MPHYYLTYAYVPGRLIVLTLKVNLVVFHPRPSLQLLAKCSRSGSPWARVKDGTASLLLRVWIFGADQTALKKGLIEVWSTFAGCSRPRVRRAVLDAFTNVHIVYPPPPSSLKLLNG